MQYYHFGYVNYNNNGFNNGMNCANGFHVYCPMETHILSLSLTHHRISPYYNPIIDCNGKKWEHLSVTTVTSS